METTKHPVTSKTKELLAELNNVMSQSNLVQEIAEKSDGSAQVPLMPALSSKKLALLKKPENYAMRSPDWKTCFE